MLAIVTKYCLPDFQGCKSSSVCTNMNFMYKWSYSSVWQKIATGHCEFNVWTLYSIFKIQYQSTKSQSISEVVCELNTK